MCMCVGVNAAWVAMRKFNGLRRWVAGLFTWNARALGKGGGEGREEEGSERRGEKRREKEKVDKEREEGMDEMDGGNE